MGYLPVILHFLRNELHNPVPVLIIIIHINIHVNFIPIPTYPAPQSWMDFFKVKVRDIRTMIVRGKQRRIGRYQGRRSNWKKAIVTLAKGQKIEIFEVK